MRNLKAEMARYGVSNMDIQKVLNISDRTVRDKVNGVTGLSFLESVKIRDSFFPNLRLEYLFATDNEETTA